MRSLRPRGRCNSGWEMSLESSYGYLKCLSMAHRDGLEQQIARRVDGLDVGRKGTIGRDHVGHLFDRVDVRHEDVAVLVGERVVRLIAHGRRRLALHHAEHSHADRGGLAVESGFVRVHHGLEYRVAGPIDLAFIAVDALGVGKIAGRGIQPYGLGIEGAAGDVEHIEQRHLHSPLRLIAYWPAMTNCSSAILLLMNMRLAW